MPTTNNRPHTVEALLRVVEQRDAEVAFLKLMVDKLALQLRRARRAQYGRSSEQRDDPQIEPWVSCATTSRRQKRKALQCQSSLSGEQTEGHVEIGADNP